MTSLSCTRWPRYVFLPVDEHFFPRKFNRFTVLFCFFHDGVERFTSVPDFFLGICAPMPRFAAFSSSAAQMPLGEFSPGLCSSEISPLLVEPCLQTTDQLDAHCRRGYPRHSVFSARSLEPPSPPHHSPPSPHHLRFHRKEDFVSSIFLVHQLSPCQAHHIASVKILLQLQSRCTAFFRFLISSFAAFSSFLFDSDSAAENWHDFSVSVTRVSIDFIFSSRSHTLTLMLFTVFSIFSMLWSLVFTTFISSSSSVVQGGGGRGRLEPERTIKLCRGRRLYEQGLLHTTESWLLLLLECHSLITLIKRITSSCSLCIPRRAFLFMFFSCLDFPLFCSLLLLGFSLEFKSDGPLSINGDVACLFLFCFFRQPAW